MRPPEKTATVVESEEIKAAAGGVLVDGNDPHYYHRCRTNEARSGLATGRRKVCRSPVSRNEEEEAVGRNPSRQQLWEAKEVTGGLWLSPEMDGSGWKG